MPRPARILNPEDPQLPYMQEIGPDGTTTLKGLPVGDRESLIMSHQTFVLKDEVEDGRIEYSVDSAEPLKKRLVVIPAK